MIIAITADSGDMKSRVNPRFGRAPVFILFNTGTGDYQVVDNAINLSATQGAGIQAAKTIINHNVDVLISGRFGPKAYNLLEGNSVKTFVCDETTVKKAIEMYLSDGLKEFTKEEVF